jgi:hypothetical protein
MLQGVRSQHAALYATHLGKSRAGVLSDTAEFFALFNDGERGGQRRYFTYSLLADSLWCSETGATFATDMMSKHAMHAGGAEEVLFAGGRVGGWVGGGAASGVCQTCLVCGSCVSVPTSSPPPPTPCR